MSSVYARMGVSAAIHQTEAEVTAALNALNLGQTEEARSRLLAALMSLTEAADTLGRQ